MLWIPWRVWTGSFGASTSPFSRGNMSGTKLFISPTKSQGSHVFAVFAFRSIPENGQFKGLKSSLAQSKETRGGNRCNFSFIVFETALLGLGAEHLCKVYGEHLYQSKNKVTVPLGKKKTQTQTYKKAVLKILRQGLYNCTPLQAWIKLRVFYYFYVALISAVWPAAKFSTEKSSENPKFSTEGLVMSLAWHLSWSGKDHELVLFQADIWKRIFCQGKWMYYLL